MIGDQLPMLEPPQVVRTMDSVRGPRMGQFAAGCLASRVWKPTEAERWPLGQALAGEGQGWGSCLSCAAGFTALYFGPTPSKSSQLSKVVGLTMAPAAPCLTERASQGWTGTFIHTVDLEERLLSSKRKSLILGSPE